MKKTELIQAVENARQNLLQTIENLSPEQINQPGVSGNWSVKDILSQISFWEAETVTLLFQIRQGQKPTTIPNKPLDEAKQNQVWHEQSRDRPLEQVMNDFAGVHRQLTRRLSEYTDQQLDQESFYPWLKGKSLSQLILSRTANLETEYLQEIRKWMDRQVQ